MKILAILAISIIIFVLSYLKSEEHKFSTAVVCSCLTGVLGFAGPYVVECIGGTDINIGIDSEKNSIEEHVHEVATTEKKNVIAVTCLDAGSYELVSYCKCGEELEIETIPLLPVGHNYNKVVTGASCNKSGFTTYECTKCRDTYVSDYTESLGHNYVEGVCSRCKSISSDYESLVVSKVNQFLEKENYDEALKAVDDALKLMDSESLNQLHDSIQMAQVEADNAILYTGRLVNFMTYSGSINGSDESNTYSMTASTSGDYRFTLSNMVNGFEVKLFVFDSAGNKIGGYSGVGNNDGITCLLDKDNTYSIKVASYTGTGDFVLTVGQPKEIVDITIKENVYDSIEYVDQCNKYTFIPSIEGIYRFDLYNMVNGFEVKFFVYDSLGYKVGGYSGVGNGDGLTVEMIAGETYTIKISQYSNLGAYDLLIGKQLALQEITEQNSLSGSITYTNQNNKYIYIPSLAGKYKFTLQNMKNGFEVKFFVYDSLGYKVGGYSGAGNDSVITASLKADEQYTIQIVQYSKFGNYEVGISKE